MNLNAERVKTRKEKVKVDAKDGKRKAGEQKVQLRQEANKTVVEEPIQLVEESKTLNI